MAGKGRTGRDFTLNDFLEQMQAVKEDGLSVQTAGHVARHGDMKQQLESLDDREIDRVSAIIQSMTLANEEDPKVLNASRRQHIAKGAGVEVQNINNLVDRFADARR